MDDNYVLVAIWKKKRETLFYCCFALKIMNLALTPLLTTYLCTKKVDLTPYSTVPIEPNMFSKRTITLQRRVGVLDKHLKVGLVPGSSLGAGLVGIVLTAE